MTKVSTNLTWTNSDRGPSGRWPRDGNIKRIEDREDMNVWDQEVLHKLWLMQTSLLRSTISYILFPGEKWDEVSKRTVRQCCIKGTQGISTALQAKHTAALRLISIALHSGKSWVLRIQSTPKDPVAGDYWLCQAYSWF